MLEFAKKYEPVIVLVVAILTLLLNIRQTQLMSHDCGCKDELGPLS